MTESANQRTIPVDLISRVRALVEKLNKRAARIGVEPFALAVGPARAQRRYRNIAPDGTGLDPYDIEVADISITGAPIKVGSHEMVGRVDFEAGLTIVNARPGADMPVKYRSATTFCEHCNSMRKRNAVFVFKREAGDHIQVGRTCLKDFLGHDPDNALWAIREAGRLMGDIDEESSRGGGSAAAVIAPIQILEAAALSVRETGFMSKAVAEERGCASTASDTMDILFPSPRDKERTITEDDKAKAMSVLAWVLETIAPKETQSDYEHNAVELCRAEYVSLRRVGILASLVGAYNRAMEAQIERAAVVNAHVGEVGKRQDFEAVYRGENVIDTAYGALYIGRFQSPEGLLVYKGASPFWPSTIKAGDAVKFKGTIKEHGDYKGTLQTMVSRCKLLDA